MTQRAVLFDLDGTLVNSAESVARCWDRLAVEAGFDISVLDGLHGIPAKTFIETLLGPQRLDEFDRWTAWHLKNECEDVEGVVAIDGVFDLLAALDKSDFAWGIVTSCQRPLAVARLNAAGIPIPEVFVTSDDITHGKPDPEPYLLGAKLIGVDPANSHVIEDAPAGIRSGKAAGAIVYGIVGTHRADQLTEADFVMETMAQVQAQLFA